MQVLILCEELLLGRLLCRLIETAGHATNVTSDMEEAMNLCRRHPSLIIVNTPENPIKSVMFCKKVKRISPSTKVALLVGRGVYLKHETCPDGLLSRDSTPEDFLSNISQLIRGNAS